MGGGEIEFVKEPSIIEQKAYRDTWGRGLDGYLQWFYETAMLLRELLSDTGSLFVHLDWHIGHYVKTCLDEVMGLENFINEIIWHYDQGARPKSAFGRKHDTIFWYQQSEKHTFNIEDVLVPFDSKMTEWRYTRGGQQGKEMPQGKVPSDVWDIKLNAMALEHIGYPTQKPEALLERIIKASSNEGDLVLDCFCGSGTTAAVAEKLGRRWITADLGRFAIHTARKRLLGIPNVRPFVVQNLGKYERQVWQAAEFGERAEAAALAYRAFILDLYHARALTGSAWLHGLKNGRMVHVGSVDAPISPGDVTNIVSEFARAVGTGADAPQERGVDVLGWDFAFELHEVAKQQAARAGIDVRFVRIPREVLEKKAVEQGDIRFFELAALAVDVQQKGRTVTLALSDFVIPLDDVPEDVQRAITHWSQWVDYWAVDWDNKSDTFHNEWQSYRTRASKDLQKQVAHTYDQPGAYTIVVKVIDLLGNDTTKTLNVTTEGAGG